MTTLDNMIIRKDICKKVGAEWDYAPLSLDHAFQSALSMLTDNQLVEFQKWVDKIFPQSPEG